MNHDTSKNSHAYLGKRPYQEKSSEQVKEFVCHDRGHLDIPPLCTESIAEVLIRCWNYYPEHRPTFEILLEKFEDLLVFKEEFQAIACHDECDLASNQNTTIPEIEIHNCSTTSITFHNATYSKLPNNAPYF